MNIVLLAAIALVLLLGLIAVGVGHRGWSWGTVVGAVLLLLATTGYIYLAARLAERERSWRKLVANNEAELSKIRGGPGVATDTLATLRARRDRWGRVLAFVDTWRGRSWQGSAFTPPRGGKPGSLSIEMPSEESETAPLNAGAEVAVFDNTGVEEEGKFLGIFRVLKSTANKGETTSQITVAAADAPSPPSAADTALWSRDHESVTLFETVPVDRWLAFHTISGDPAAEAETGTDSDGWMPKGKKISADEKLRRLEAQIEQFKRHDETVPEDEWEKIGADLAAGAIPPGSHWAVVEFDEPVKFTKKGGFELDDTGDAPAAPPAAADDDEGPVGAPGAMAPGEMIEPGADDAAGEGSAGVITKRFKLKQYGKGSQAELDLQTALFLQTEKHWCHITKVIYRRPLADPYTALRGGEFVTKGADGQPLRAEGLFAIRQALLTELAEIDRNVKRIDTARSNVDTQSEAVAEEKRQSTDDLSSWKQDVAAAEKVSAAFDARLRQATLDLVGLEDAIVRLGRELTGAVATLTQTIDAAAPPTTRQR